jgi:hypothetical protein
MVVLNYDTMGKEALRKEMRDRELSYGKLNNDGMRAALRTNDAEIAAAMPTEDEFEMTQEELSKQTVRPQSDDPAEGNCPSCGIHLSNGLLGPDDEAIGPGGRSYNPPKTLWETGQLNHQFHCMGCGHNWGEVRAPYAAPVRAPRTRKGVSIEKDREERNGVKRPSLGGVCREVWDWLDERRAKVGQVPTAKEVREASPAAGWNPNNAMIEFYQWRKFNGITGRSK